MWMISKTGFVSLIQDRNDPSKVWVRARIKEDIAMMFPAHTEQIITKIGADYIYRLIVPRDVAALAMWNSVQEIDYTGHAKENMNRHSHPNKDRMSAYYKIWNALAVLQPFAPYSHKPRPVGSYRPKGGYYPSKSNTPVSYGGQSALPGFSGTSKSGHYDWNSHPNAATGYQGGRALTPEDYPNVKDIEADLDSWDDPELPPAAVAGDDAVDIDGGDSDEELKFIERIDLVIDNPDDYPDAPAVGDEDEVWIEYFMQLDEEPASVQAIPEEIHDIVETIEDAKAEIDSKVDDLISTVGKLSPEEQAAFIAEQVELSEEEIVAADQASLDATETQRTGPSGGGSAPSNKRSRRAARRAANSQGQR